MDWAATRKWMVDGQLRPNKVTNGRLLEAMHELPREDFVPAAFAARAYADADVPLIDGRALAKPMTFARLVQLADVKPGEKVLLVGANTGYGAVVLARMGAVVTALESDAGLLAMARGMLAKFPEMGVTLAQGPLTEGHADGAPYDLVLIEGMVEAIPAALVGQIAEGGRLVAVRRQPGRVPSAIIGHRLGGGLTVTEAFDLSAPLLSAFLRVPSFSL
ncbi:protein-L-isoaspartate O-methyltransferase [Acetobacteraceae bacterium H6797]|nr:protein-L-isoaspartate O-methyltransferase [Acetobacteraceae bacterium H6797]